MNICVYILKCNPEDICVPVLTGCPVCPCTFRAELTSFPGVLRKHNHVKSVIIDKVLRGNNPKFLVFSNNESLFLSYFTEGQFGISSLRDTGFQIVNHLENYVETATRGRKPGELYSLNVLAQR